jgi:hypothetical protein
MPPAGASTYDGSVADVVTVDPGMDLKANEQPDGQMFVADTTEVVVTGLNAEATQLVVESWTP